MSSRYLPFLCAIAAFSASLALSAPASAACDIYGNCYQTSPTFGGGAYVQGRNGRTGSTWSSQNNQYGDQRGVDSNGNSWTYNNGTRTYRRLGPSGVKTCFGSGASRRCY